MPNKYEEVKDELTDVHLSDDERRILGIESYYGWMALIWLLEHSENVPALYVGNPPATTLESLLGQVHQEMKMIAVRGGKDD